MEYSLSDIQLPDPPKERSSKEKNLSSKLEKKRTSKCKEDTVSRNNAKDEANGIAKEVSDTVSPKACVENDNHKKDQTDDSKSEKTNVNEGLKNSLKEGNKPSVTDTPLAMETNTAAKETCSENVTLTKVLVSEGNSDPINDVNSAKQTHSEADDKKISSSASSSNNSNKNKEQNKPRKQDAVASSSTSSSKRKHPDNDDEQDQDSAVDKESAKTARKRKNRRTSRSSSQSSSSDSSSSSSPERELSRSKKSGKSGSSSEGIASPSSSGSSSASETEEDKKSVPHEKPKADNVSSVKGSEEIKQRRKINRNLPVKAVQEIRDAEMGRSQEHCSALQKVKKDETDKKEQSKETEVREIKFTPRKLSLTSLKSSEKCEAQDSDKSNSKLGVKKRKWGNCAASLPRASVSISSDSLKSLIPDLKPLNVAPVLSDQDDLSNPVGMESPPKKEPKIVNLPASEETVNESISSHLQTDKTANVSDVKDVPSEPARVSPPHNPISNILFIKNLVRPFTLLQLRELLKQTGNVVEESFWIDKIKSKCIVMYETVEQAVATRTALHGTRWPLSNPKILSVDFSTEDELDVHKNMTEHPKPLKATQESSLEKQDVKETQAVDIPKRKNREDHKRDKERQKLSVTHVREWDKDKISQDSPEHASHRVEKEPEKARSDKRKEKKDSKRKVDEDAPAKLLDDLFRKTRASPCIYWLPLTEEQAKQREEERQARRLEREKRMQQRKEQEENERRNRTKGHSGREKENRRSQSRSRSPQGRRR